MFTLPTRRSQPLPPLKAEFDKSNLKGKILFCDVKEDDYYLINANGTNMVNFTTDDMHNPVLSPQSDKIAWILRDKNRPHDYRYSRKGICVTDINGKNKRILDTVPGTNKEYEQGYWPNLCLLKWSPDGQNISYYYTAGVLKGDDTLNEKVYKVVINAENGEKKAVEPLEESTPFGKEKFSDFKKGPHYSPNGQKAVMENDIVDIKSGHKISLAPYVYWEGSDYIKVAWSPDSKKLAFLCTSYDRYIYVINADGTDIRNITNYVYKGDIYYSGGYGLSTPSWSADNKYLCCTYNQELSYFDIFKTPCIIPYVVIIDTENGKKVTLTKGKNPIWISE